MHVVDIQDYLRWFAAVCQQKRSSFEDHFGWKMGLEPLKMFSVYQLVTERTKSLYHTLALCEKRWFAYLFEAFQYLQR